MGPLAIAGLAMSAYNLIKGSPQIPRIIDSDAGSQIPQPRGDLGSILNTAGKYIGLADGISGSTDSPQGPAPQQKSSDFTGSESGLGQVLNSSNFYNDNAGGSNLYNSLKQGDTLQFGNFS